MSDTSWLSKCPVMTSEEFKKIFTEWKQQAPGLKKVQLRHKLERGNMRFVARIAYSYLPQCKLEVNELIAAGSIGLSHALDLYDPENGASFLAYSIHWIKREIRDEIRKSLIGKSFQIPAKQHYMAKSLRYLSRIFKTKHGRDPTFKELSVMARDTKYKVFADSTAEKIEQLMIIVFNQTSKIDSLVNSSNEVFGTSDPDVLMLIQEQENKKLLMSGLKRLDNRQQTVINLHFGLNGNREHTLEEIGNLYDLSKERIRQIELIAFRRLKVHMQQIEYKKRKT